MEGGAFSGCNETVESCKTELFERPVLFLQPKHVDDRQFELQRGQRDQRGHLHVTRAIERSRLVEWKLELWSRALVLLSIKHHTDMGDMRGLRTKAYHPIRNTEDYKEIYKIQKNCLHVTGPRLRG